MPLGALVGASVAGAQIAAANTANKKARKFAAKQARLSRSFSAKQSATVAQRGVKDLRAAGLNPILAATGGLTAPAAGAGIASAPQTDTSGIATAATSATRLYQELENLRAQKKKTDLENDIIEPDAIAGRAKSHLLNKATPFAKSLSVGFEEGFQNATTAAEKFRQDRDRYRGPEKAGGMFPYPPKLKTKKKARKPQGPSSRSRRSKK